MKTNRAAVDFDFGDVREVKGARVITGLGRRGVGGGS